MINITVKKLTDISLLRRANSFTTGRDSNMTLATAYRNGHSTIRTQIFWVECTNIPLFIASQLVRSHVGVQFFQRSKRTDRGGEDFRTVCGEIINDVIKRRDVVEIVEEIDSLTTRFDRYAPTDLAFIINAEALMNMAHKRLCAKASQETRDLMNRIVGAVKECDADLAKHLVRQCVCRGGICPEQKGCRYCETPEGEQRLEYYKSLYLAKGEETEQ